MKTLTADEAAALERADRIVAFRDDGLFSRVMCVLNVLRLSEVLGKPGVFYWDTAPRAGNERHGYTEPLSSAIRCPAVVEVGDETMAVYRAERNFTAWPIVALPGENHAEVRAHAQRLALELTLHDGSTVGDRLARGSVPLGIHIRAGDAAALRWLGGRFLPKSLWLAAIQALVSGDDNAPAIYVASDSDEVLAELAVRYPDIIRSRLDGTAAGATKIESDLLDALAFGSGGRLIGLDASAFASFGSTVAGVPLISPAEILGISDVVRDIRTLAFSEYVQDVSALMSGEDLPPRERRRITARLTTMSRNLERRVPGQET